MSRLELPLLSKKVWATGDLVLRAELDLLIRDDNGVWRPETFRVDSGTEMTSMAATRARALDLPMPRNPIVLAVNGIRRTVRPGLIRARVVGMDDTEYTLPCFFLGNPDATTDPNQPPFAAHPTSWALPESWINSGSSLTARRRPTPGAALWSLKRRKSRLFALQASATQPADPLNRKSKHGP